MSECDRVWQGVTGCDWVCLVIYNVCLCLSVTGCDWVCLGIYIYIYIYIYNVCLCLSVTGCDWACLVIYNVWLCLSVTGCDWVCLGIYMYNVCDWKWWKCVICLIMWLYNEFININNHHYLFSSCFDNVGNSKQSTAYVGFLFEIKQIVILLLYLFTVSLEFVQILLAIKK